MKALITGATLLIGILAIVYYTNYWENRLGINSGDSEEKVEVPKLPEGCYVMKRINTEEYSCFGCSGAVCIEGDLRLWEYIKESIASSKGYYCKTTASGCQLSS